MEQPDYSERLIVAQTEIIQDEKLKDENFNSVDTEGFEKAVVILKYWAEMTQQAMQENKKIRIVIKYNAEAKKTDFSIYTPIEDGTDGKKQEHSKN